MQKWHAWRVGIDGEDGNPKFDLLIGNIFNFRLFVPGKSQPIACSAWFNITSDTVNAHGQLIGTTLTSASTQQAPTASSTRVESAVGSLSTTNSDSPTSSGVSEALSPSASQTNSSGATIIHQSSSLRTSDKIGLGIGIGVGLPVLLALSICSFWLLKQKSTEHRSQMLKVQPNGRSQRPLSGFVSVRAPSEAVSATPPSELMSVSSRRELLDLNSLAAVTMLNVHTTAQATSACTQVFLVLPCETTRLTCTFNILN